MNTRIKEIRTALNLTLEKFCRPLGIYRSAMSNIENGNRNVTRQLCKSICHVNWDGKLVNEEWLRTGNGPMFFELPGEDKYFKAATKLSNDPLIVSIITGYYLLDEIDRKKSNNLSNNCMNPCKHKIIRGMKINLHAPFAIHSLYFYTLFPFPSFYSPQKIFHHFYVA